MKKCRFLQTLENVRNLFDCESVLHKIDFINFNEFHRFQRFSRIFFINRYQLNFLSNLKNSTWFHELGGTKTVLYVLTKLPFVKAIWTNYTFSRHSWKSTFYTKIGATSTVSNCIKPFQQADWLRHSWQDWLLSSIPENSTVGSNLTKSAFAYNRTEIDRCGEYFQKLTFQKLDRNEGIQTVWRILVSSTFGQRIGQWLSKFPTGSTESANSHHFKETLFTQFHRIRPFPRTTFPINWNELYIF